MSHQLQCIVHTYRAIVGSIKARNYRQVKNPVCTREHSRCAIGTCNSIGRWPGKRADVDGVKSTGRR